MVRSIIFKNSRLDAFLRRFEEVDRLDAFLHDLWPTNMRGHEN